MKDRIAKLIKNEGLTSQQFAEITEIQSSTISHILSGRNSPSFKVIYSILENYPSINPDWLILGKGEMYRVSEIADNKADDDDLKDEEKGNIDTVPNVEADKIPTPDNLFTKVNDSTNSDFNEGKIQLFDLPSSVGQNDDESDVKIENNRVDAESSKTLDNKPIAEKIIIIYNDKTFEIFNMK